MKPISIITIVKFLLLLLFAYTAISKLANHAIFLVQLESFPWLEPAAGFISWTVPLTEAFIVVLLFFPAAFKFGLYASCLLLTLFTMYLILMVVLRTNLPCSCGGVIAKFSWQQHIIFNLFFIALGIGGIRRYKKINKQSTTHLNALLQ